jgi:hypothetical protein
MTSFSGGVFMNTKAKIGMLCIAVAVMFSVLLAQAPIIITQPESVTIEGIAEHKLFVETKEDGNGPLTYQWYVGIGPNIDTDFRPIVNETDNWLVDTWRGTGAVNPLYYYVVVTDANSLTTVSSVANVTRDFVSATAPLIVTQPQDVSVKVGDKVVLSVSAISSDGGTLSYSWGGANGIGISGATESTFSPYTDRAGTFKYHVLVINTNTKVNGGQINSSISREVTVVVTSCEEIIAVDSEVTPKNTVTNCDSEISPGESTLFDTRWKLVGFFDVERNELREPRYGDPWGDDPDYWYTIHFLPDTVRGDHGLHAATGTSIMNAIGCLYIADYTLSTFILFEVIATVMGDRFDGQDYIDALREVQAFELKDTSLKLYYNDKKNYLLFRPLEEETATISVISREEVIAVDSEVIPKNEGTATISVTPLALRTVFIAGPNPANRHSDMTNFFWQGEVIKNGRLTVYDVAGNVVNKIRINDTAQGDLSKRQVGSWDLTDSVGRPVPIGTYLVKGIINTAGKREKVSVVISIVR